MYNAKNKLKVHLFFVDILRTFFKYWFVNYGLMGNNQKDSKVNNYYVLGFEKPCSQVFIKLRALTTVMVMVFEISVSSVSPMNNI